MTPRNPELTTPEWAFIAGVPLLWGILLLFHPSGDGTAIYADLQDQVTPWLVVHLGQMLFIPLFAVAVDLLLRGVEGTAARVSRVGLVFFAVFYTAFELLQGIGNGILIHVVNGLPAADQATGADVIQGFSENVLIRDMGVFVSIGSLGLISAMIAAGIALHRHAGAPVAVPVLFGLAGFLITAHPPPFGPTGLALFIVAVAIFWRSRSAERAAVVVGQPSSA
jgi:hypothetical protein